MLRLKIITASSVEPVAVAEVKTHTHITHTEEDGLIQDWIKSGRELAESYQRRAYTKQVIQISYDCFPAMPIELPRSPLVSLDAVRYYDADNTETVMGLASFLVDADGEPGRVDLANNILWPSVVLRTMNAVQFQFTAGYGDAATDVPRNVKDAIMLYCSWRSENRAAEDDKVPESFYQLLRHDRL